MVTKLAPGAFFGRPHHCRAVAGITLMESLYGPEVIIPPHQHAAAYFDLLEAEQAGADVRDFDRFRKRVADLFAQPENPAGAGLHVLTIHKAKGLEFDTVIVPGLGRRAKSDGGLRIAQESQSDERPAGLQSARHRR